MFQVHIESKDFCTRNEDDEPGFTDVGVFKREGGYVFIEWMEGEMSVSRMIPEHTVYSMAILYKPDNE